jgi:hypothetical protein
MKLVAVNGRRFARKVLEDAIRASKGSKQPIELLAENAEFFRTYKVDYSGGLRYPALVRDPSKPDLLGAIIKPLTGK